MKLQRVNYKELNAKQKEIYNFQKVAGMLADFGFNCIKLTDDWHGADFLAYHKDGTQIFRVQLKSRFTIDKKYSCKNLYMVFRAKEDWYLIAHDELVGITGEVTTYLTSYEWREKGHYDNAAPSKKLLKRISSFRVPTSGHSGCETEFD